MKVPILHSLARYFMLFPNRRLTLPPQYAAFLHRAHIVSSPSSGSLLHWLHRLTWPAGLFVGVLFCICVASCRSFFDQSNMGRASSKWEHIASRKDTVKSGLSEAGYVRCKWSPILPLKEVLGNL